MDKDAKNAITIFGVRLSELKSTRSVTEEILRTRDSGISDEIKTFIHQLCAEVTNTTGESWKAKITNAIYKPIDNKTTIIVVINSNNSYVSKIIIDFGHNWVDVKNESFDRCRRDKAEIYGVLALLFERLVPKPVEHVR